MWKSCISRMQEYQPAQAFDMVISRAVASLEELYQQAIHVLVRPGGRMLFMKGSLPGDEMKDLAPGRETLHIERLQYPAWTRSVICSGWKKRIGRLQTEINDVAS